MSEPNTPPVQVVSVRPLYERVRAIVRGLSADLPVEEIARVGVSLKHAPGAPLSGAMTSAMHRTRMDGGRLKRAFLQGQWNWLMQHLERQPPSLVACWNGIKGHRLLAMEAARAQGHETLYLEEAPLPGRITADFRGVNAGNSLPRNPAAYRAWAARTDELPDWRALGHEIRARASEREDVKQETGAPEGNYIFCPLQVPGDSQITVYGGWIASIEQMIGALHVASRALPRGWHLRVKEHPSARQSFGAELRALTNVKFKLDNATDTMAQVSAARAVLTVNSSVGLEAFFHDKPVITLGQAFYAMPGLAYHAPNAARLYELLGEPEALGFDADARNAFMAYLVGEYFPLESDVVAGRVNLGTLRARDARMAQIVANL